jgi:predicted DNA-binding protein (MmcQ/YjbR family)
MNIEQLREYCLSKPGTTECFPFDEVTLVFKVGSADKNKIYALASLEKIPQNVNLKCDPERAIELREKYEAVIPGYHMNKQHWNTVRLEGDVHDKLFIELIDHSYELIINSLTKKAQAIVRGE